MTLEQQSATAAVAYLLHLSNSFSIPQTSLDADETSLHAEFDWLVALVRCVSLETDSIGRGWIRAGPNRENTAISARESAGTASLSGCDDSERNRWVLAASRMPAGCGRRGVKGRRCKGAAWCKGTPECREGPSAGEGVHEGHAETEA